MKRDLAWLGKQLEIGGDFVSAVAYGSGHINDTYAATYAITGGRAGGRASQRRYVHQRINTDVFSDPVSLMHNLSRVTRHIRIGLEAAGADDVDRRVLSLVRNREGGEFVIDERGGYWRTFPFIEGATTFDVVEVPDQALEVGRAFGEFQRQLIDLGPPALAHTIPGFHDSPRRLAAFRHAVEADACNRAAAARDEIERIEGYASMVDDLLGLHRGGEIPLRVVHNDTKINNVLIDDKTGEGLCVIDLDTVMPGLAADDFGDLVRTSASFAREDDRDLSRAVVEMPIFEALATGYLSTASRFLNAAEVDSLVLGGKLMTYEMALRFLADHLDGDTYFRIHHEGHNLDRARVQIALLDSIAGNEARMRAIVGSAARNAR